MVLIQKEVDTMLSFINKYIVQPNVQLNVLIQKYKSVTLSCGMLRSLVENAWDSPHILGNAIR